MNAFFTRFEADESVPLMPYTYTTGPVVYTQAEKSYFIAHEINR